MTRTTAVFDRSPAEEFLLARGAGQRPHPGGTLHEHLLRVADLLAERGADRHLQAAGLCHACYGTDGYDQPLLALPERPVLAALIGAEAHTVSDAGRITVLDSAPKALRWLAARVRA